MEILIYNSVGKFAENKDKARDIRVNEILPSLERGEEITLNFLTELNQHTVGGFWM